MDIETLQKANGHVDKIDSLNQMIAAAEEKAEKGGDIKEIRITRKNGTTHDHIFHITDVGSLIAINECVDKLVKEMKGARDMEERLLKAL